MRVPVWGLTLLGALCWTAQAAALPDNRAWELVSPLEKNGGQVSTPAEAGAGSFRAALQGNAVAYASKASFAGGAGAAPFSSYISRRTPSGWITENITPAQLTGAYTGSPYVAFSADLGKGLILNPARCPTGDPCLPGYKVRDNSSGQILASLTDPSEFDSGESEITFYVNAGHLYREQSGSATDLTPSGGVDSFLTANHSGTVAYYRIAQGIWRWVQGAGGTQVLTAFGTGALADTSALTSGTTATGNRLYFTTATALVPADTNVDFSSGGGIADVYQWQTQGQGSCAKAGGCVDLISSGSSQAKPSSGGFLDAGSVFVDASQDGSDVYFLTDVSLVGADPGAVDLYDARVGGGFSQPDPPFPCEGDSCQIIPSPPQDPTLTTTLKGPGNSALKYRRYGAPARKARCPKGKRSRKGKHGRGSRCAKKRGSRR